MAPTPPHEEPDCRRTPPARRSRLLTRLAVMLSVIATVALTACSGGAATGGSAEGGSKEIIAIFYTRTLEYYATMAKAMKSAAEGHGYQLTERYANFDLAQEQEMFRNAIAQRPAGILLAPLQADAWGPVLEEAKAAGVPVLLVANDVPESQEDARLTFVGPDIADLGRQKATWIAEQLGGQGEVLVIHFIRGHPYTEDQRKAYTEVFAGYPGISVVEGPYGASSEEGLAATENALSSNPNPKAVFFDGDDTAIGGLQALEERGATGVVTASSDGVTAAVDAVRTGRLGLTVSIRPFETGTAAVDTLVSYLQNGTRPQPNVFVELLTITKDTVDTVPPKELGQ